MSKRKIKIEVGCFYIAYGGNPHPAFIYEKTKYGTYKAIKTGTTNSKEMVEISSLEGNCKKQYANKRPFEGTKKDFGKKLLGLTINNDDLITINEIKKRKSKKSRRAKEAYLKYKKMPSSD